MLVVSIGSCFSKRVARQIEGANLISSVYHNRSDVLLTAIRSKGATLKPRAKICELMGIPIDGTDEFSPFSVISNQSAEGFGLHDLPEGVPILQALSRMKLDLILIDNFMDLSAKLYRTPLGNYFCRYSGFEPPEGLRLRRKLSPQESAANFEQIVDLLRGMQPTAKIVFLQFPTNNYPDREKWVWSWEFRDALRLPEEVSNVHPRKVKPRWPDKEPHHFHYRTYSRYAEEALSWMNKSPHPSTFVRSARDLRNRLGVRISRYLSLRFS